MTCFISEFIDRFTAEDNRVYKSAVKGMNDRLAKMERGKEAFVAGRGCGKSILALEALKRDIKSGFFSKADAEIVSEDEIPEAKPAFDGNIFKEGIEKAQKNAIKSGADYADPEPLVKKGEMVTVGDFGHCYIDLECAEDYDGNGYIKTLSLNKLNILSWTHWKKIE